jgi:hypothetical protein
VGLKLNVTHQPLVYEDYMNLFGNNIVTLEKNTEILTDTSKKSGIEVNAEKTDYILLSPHQNAQQNHDIKRVKRSFENVAQFKYLGMIVKNQNMIQVEIKSRLIRDNCLLPFTT